MKKVFLMLMFLSPMMMIVGCNKLVDDTTSTEYEKLAAFDKIVEGEDVAESASVVQLAIDSNIVDKDTVLANEEEMGESDQTNEASEQINEEANQINEEINEPAEILPIIMDDANEFRTVLYSDGTLVINEKLADKLTNVNEVEVYEAMDEDGMNYVFGRSDQLPWFAKLNDIKTVRIGSELTPASIQFWFRDLKNCTLIDLTLLNTQRIEYMFYMFHNCEKLEEIKGLENLKTERVLNMYCMFYNCKALEEINMSSFSAAKLTTTKQMFYNCHSVETLDLGSFGSAPQLEDMNFMFVHCKKLQTVYVSAAFDENKVSNKADMFLDCPAEKFTKR